MRILPLALLLGFSASAYAEDFESRFVAANHKNEGPEVTKYILAQAQRIRGAARPCLGSISPGTVQFFRFVADVSSDGVLSNIETDLQSPLTACFKEHVSKQSLASPPKLPFQFGARVKMDPQDGF